MSKLYFSQDDRPPLIKGDRRSLSNGDDSALSNDNDSSLILFLISLNELGHQMRFGCLCTYLSLSYSSRFWIS